MEPLLELKDVCLHRGQTQILQQVNWQTWPGQHWVILGPNGAGKTSLARIIAGRLFPSSGQASILGEELGHLEINELHQRVGFCSSALSRRISGDELVKDVILSCAYGVTGTWKETYETVDINRAYDLARAFGVECLMDRKFTTLSDGERQRTVIARSLMADPEVLVLDEPAAGLDLGAREELLAALTELAHYPASPMIVLVTHHVEEIPIGFTNAMIMSHGQIATSGGLSEVVTSSNISGVFKMPLDVGISEGRWWVRAGKG